MGNKKRKEIRVKILGLFYLECKGLTFNEIRALLYLISIIAFLGLVFWRLIFSIF
jgi:hypothetical protein